MVADERIHPVPLNVINSVVDSLPCTVVTSDLETDGDVHHLIADRVHDFSHLAGNLESKSRDFC